MQIKRIITISNDLGIESIKFIYYYVLKKIIKKGNNKKITKIKSKKTGKNNLVIRPFSTDLILVKNLLLKNGEYDFLFDKEYEWIKEAKVIIDAGANIGIFSRIIKQFNKNSIIIAIEPEQDNYNILFKNVENQNVYCKKMGLWNKKCNLIINPSTTGEWGFTVEEVSQKNNNSIEAISVQDIIEEYNIDYIDVFKIDIEGSEYEVFDENCNKWIEKVRMFIIEFHDRKKAGCSARVISKMKEYGFKMKKYNENTVFIK